MTFLLLLAAASLQSEAPEETPWVVQTDAFADAAACVSHLGALAADMRGASWHEIVEGPYEIAPDDVRFHSVNPEGDGHRISEYRCLQAELSSRTWTHSLVKSEAKSWLESAAERLNKGTAEQ